MVLPISWISTAKCCFPVNLRYKSENLNKIWKFKNPRWWPPVTSFIWLLLPWKPIRHCMVSQIVSKVEGGLIDPPLRLCVTIFSSRLLGLRTFWIFCKGLSLLKTIHRTPSISGWKNNKANNIRPIHVSIWCFMKFIWIWVESKHC